MLSATVLRARPRSASRGWLEKLYQVTFFDREPPAGLAEQVATLAVGEERFVAHGREWYTYHPAGVARSKLATKISSRNLGVLATARNWTTVRAPGGSGILDQLPQRG